MKVQESRKQELRAKPKGLPSTFPSGTEVAEHYEKQEAKHDAWNPPLGQNSLRRKKWKRSNPLDGCLRKTMLV